jgi:hypothetical protein
MDWIHVAQEEASDYGNRRSFYIKGGVLLE